MKQGKKTRARMERRLESYKSVPDKVKSSGYIQPGSQNRHKSCPVGRR